ncbi:hypothetical protein PHMEG_00019920 [Phytophthora megakarya]|uniref:PiggyBac transposable element-derived protein domain-containing protein n=1 Tax=Phytophthora megakarya TaxID=4795 RepID=A0A225VT09_9STRA|nr:hypothetical protein PHMEG_00019920 [Phytophthora megakarya]
MRTNPGGEVRVGNLQYRGQGASRWQVATEEVVATTPTSSYRAENATQASPHTCRNLADEFEGTSSATVELRPHSGTVVTVPDESKEPDEIGNEGMNNVMYVTSTINAEVNSNIGKFVTFDSDGENDEGTGWDDDELTGEGEPLFGVDDDGPPQPELLFDASLLEDIGGVARITAGRMPKQLLKDMAKSGWSSLSKQTPYPYLMESYEPRPALSMLTDYPILYNGQYGPTTAAQSAAATPLGSFLYFVKPQLWEDIATTSKEYFKENLDERVEGIFNKQVAREKNILDSSIRAELAKTSDITARELCIFIGLLIARTIAPNKEKLENHWKTTDEGAIPRGCFGKFMEPTLQRQRGRMSTLRSSMEATTGHYGTAAAVPIWVQTPSNNGI